jgi:PncC family amidohydrolase
VLVSRQEVLAVGETSAGGALASLISDTPTSRQWFRGGLVEYTGAKAPLVRGIQDVAGVYGVVSEQYVAALAQFVQRTFGCAWAIAESGIAGPQSGRRSSKPVGMLCIAVVGPVAQKELAEEQSASSQAPNGILAGDGAVWTAAHRLTDLGRAQNQRQFAMEALRFYWSVLRSI